MIGATSLKAHRAAISMGTKRRGRIRPVGRTKGRMNTVQHAICVSRGRPLDPFITNG